MGRWPAKASDALTDHGQHRHLLSIRSRRRVDRRERADEERRHDAAEADGARVAVGRVACVELVGGVDDRQAGDSHEAVEQRQVVVAGHDKDVRDAVLLKYMNDEVWCRCVVAAWYVVVCSPGRVGPQGLDDKGGAAGRRQRSAARAQVFWLVVSFLAGWMIGANEQHCQPAHLEAVT